MFELLSRATWRDVLDVALLATMLCWLYGRLRSSRALGIAMGLAFFALVALAAGETGLVLTSWVLQGAAAVVAFGAVTIFGPEIREALFSANPLRALVGRSNRTNAATLLEPIARAAFALAQQGLGALIVLERKDPLAPIAREGVRLDAEPSEELLLALFQKTAPTHDGAAIVKGGRLERAGTVLPLSMRDDLPRHFGTRHRAAIGLAESCDALVVVVSEERGAVSLVSHGRVATPSTAGTLLARLRVETSAGGGSRLERRGLLSTWAPRLSLVVAVALVWAGLQSGGVSSVAVTVPLELGELPAGTELVALEPERVRLQIRGARRVLDGVDLAAIRVRAELGAVGPGNHERPIPLAAVSLPAGVDAQSIDPPRVRFRLERIERRELPVVAIVQRDGRRWVSRRLATTPALVRIEAAPSRLQGLEAIHTETFDEGDLASGSVRVGLELPGTVRLAPGEPDRVTVTDPARATADAPPTD